MASLTNIAANVIIERATVTRVTAFPLQQAEGLSRSPPPNVKTNIPWRRQMSTSPRYGQLHERVALR